MKVQVRVLVTPRQVLRNRTFQIELPGPASVAEVLGMLPLNEDELQQLFQRRGAGVTLNPGLAVLINGENVAFRNGLQTPISDGDRISLIHAISGG